MKRQLYLPLLITLLASLVLGALPVGSGGAYASPGWISPAGFVDGGNVWTAEPLAYDEDTVTYAYASALKSDWTGYLELTRAALDCDKVQVWVSIAIANINAIEIDVYYSDAWHNIYSDIITPDQFVEYPIGSTQSVTAMRMRFYSTKASTDGCGIHEADFNEVLPPPDISNTPDTWAFGTVSANSSYETGITYVVDSTGFRITNNVAYDVNITISATGMGSGWLLADSGDPDATHYTLWAGTELTSPDYNIQVTSGGTFLVTVLASSTRDWGLKLMTPTSFSDGGLKSGKVTLTATQA